MCTSLIYSLAFKWHQPCVFLFLASYIKVAISTCFTAITMFQWLFLTLMMSQKGQSQSVSQMPPTKRKKDTYDLPESNWNYYGNFFIIIIFFNYYILFHCFYPKLLHFHILINYVFKSWLSLRFSSSFTILTPVQLFNGWIVLSPG